MYQALDDFNITLSTILHHPWARVIATENTDLWKAHIFTAGIEGCVISASAVALAAVSIACLLVHSDHEDEGMYRKPADNVYPSPGQA